MARFDVVAEEYDQARPGYPPGVFDALAPLDGLLVVDAGAGTGIASRQLKERGARVVSLDPSMELMQRARHRDPTASLLGGDAAWLPVRSRSVDLVCFAQSWHWVPPLEGVREVARVLGPGGRWAGWWSHARADDESWFEDYWSIIERECAGTHRGQRDTDWGATFEAEGSFEVRPRITVAWTRSLRTDHWIVDLRSHSYVAALAVERREPMLDELRHVIDRRFPDGSMTVAYETWLWIGDPRP